MMKSCIIFFSIITVLLFIKIYGQDYYKPTYLINDKKDILVLGYSSFSAYQELSNLGYGKATKKEISQWRKKMDNDK